MKKVFDGWNCNLTITVSNISLVEADSIEQLIKKFYPKAEANIEVI